MPIDPHPPHELSICIKASQLPQLAFGIEAQTMAVIASDNRTQHIALNLDSCTTSLVIDEDSEMPETEYTQRPDYSFCNYVTGIL